MKKKVFRLLNSNIQLRFEAQKGKDPSFTYEKMAEHFGVNRDTAWRWCTDSEQYQKLPEPKAFSPMARKYDSMADAVKAWINDGSLDYLTK